MNIHLYVETKCMIQNCMYRAHSFFHFLVHLNTDPCLLQAMGIQQWNKTDKNICPHWTSILTEETYNKQIQMVVQVSEIQCWHKRDVVFSQRRPQTSERVSVGCTQWRSITRSEHSQVGSMKARRPVLLRGGEQRDKQEGGQRGLGGRQGWEGGCTDVVPCLLCYCGPSAFTLVREEALEGFEKGVM